MSKKSSKSPAAAKSADIRSFFSSKPASNSQPATSKNETDKSSKRKAVVLSDSDDEVKTDSKKATNGTHDSSSTSSTTPKSSKVIRISSTSSSSSKKKLTNVDLFADDNEVNNKKPRKEEKPASSESKKAPTPSSSPSKSPRTRDTKAGKDETKSSPSKSPSKKKEKEIEKPVDKKIKDEKVEDHKKDNKSNKKVEDSPKKSKTPTKVEDSPKKSKTPTKVEDSPKKSKTPTKVEDSPKKSKTPTKEKDATTVINSKDRTKVKKEEKEEPMDIDVPSSSSSRKSSKSKSKRANTSDYEDNDDYDEELMSPPKKKPREPSHDSQSPKKKEKKSSHDVSSDSGLTEEEKKSKKASGYFKFMARGPPKELGSKDFPEDCPLNCLVDYTFVITGVLPAFEKEDVVAKIEELGGRVTSAVSGKTDYLLVGDEAGESKRDKAKKLGVPMLNQDEFLNLLRNPPPPKPKKDDDKKSKSKSKGKQSTTTSTKSKPKKSHRDEDEEEEEEEEIKPSTRKGRGSATITTTTTSSSKKSISPIKSSSSPVKPIPTSTTTTTVSKKSPVKSTPTSLSSTPGDTLMWVDKYKPSQLKQVVGQQGDSSNAKKLFRWLQNWFKYHGSSTDKAKTNYPGLKDPEGKTFKVALLSGPPGVGKTTTATLVCKELGYDFTELNASDKRNKKSFVEHVQDKLNNLECMTYFNTSDVNNPNHGKLSKKHVLIMDEVDGMSGNEDRGGIQELIKLLKTSRIPIICICNDRSHPKIRSLANYCFDLRFNKPTNMQLKSFVQQICFKEKIKVPPEVQQRLIISTDQDVRQILHQLQMAKEIDMTSENASIYNPKKDLHFGPWEVAKKVFSAQDHQNMSINDKASLFFHDYNIAALFVQENYLKCTPVAANGNRFKTMDLIKATAESLAIGDLTENLVRRTMSWGLLPVQAIFHSVLPGEYMETNSMSGLEFPKWLGKNSNRNKRQRLLQELHTHMHLHISGSLEALNMEYLPYLRRAIVNPLAKQDVETAVNYMTEYNLIREDLDNITELALWPNMRDKMDNVDTKTKTAFTRQVNKESFVPYSLVKTVVKRGKGGGGGGAGEEEEELEGLGEEEEGAVADEEEEESEEEELKKDAMIKVKTSKGKGGKAGESSKGKKATETKGKRGKK